MAAVQQYRIAQRVTRGPLTLLRSEPSMRTSDGRRRTIERAMHELVLIAAQSTATDVPEAHRDWWYDLRRKGQSVIAAPLRFIDFLHRWGFPMETALLVSDWLRAYTLERYGRKPERPSAQVEVLDEAA